MLIGSRYRHGSRIHVPYSDIDRGGHLPMVNPTFNRRMRVSSSAIVATPKDILAARVTACYYRSDVERKSILRNERSINACNGRYQSHLHPTWSAYKAGLGISQCLKPGILATTLCSYWSLAHQSSKREGSADLSYSRSIHSTRSRP
jgi:hypothetical protein